jgi:uncharacterized protein
MPMLLRDQDRQRLLALMALHLPGVTGRVYGSRVTGLAHDASDLDLALIAPNAQPIPFSQLDDFRQAINDSNLPILVDARDWARLPKSFHTEIEKAFTEL